MKRVVRLCCSTSLSQYMLFRAQCIPLSENKYKYNDVHNASGTRRQAQTSINWKQRIRCCALAVRQCANAARPIGRSAGAIHQQHRPHNGLHLNGLRCGKVLVRRHSRQEVDRVAVQPLHDRQWQEARCCNVLLVSWDLHLDNGQHPRQPGVRRVVSAAHMNEIVPESLVVLAARVQLVDNAIARDAHACQDKHLTSVRVSYTDASHRHTRTRNQQPSAHNHTPTYPRTHTYTHAHTRTHALPRPALSHTHTHTHAHTHTHTQTHTHHTHTHVGTHAGTQYMRLLKHTKYHTQ